MTTEPLKPQDEFLEFDANNFVPVAGLAFQHLHKKYIVVRECEHNEVVFEGGKIKAIPNKRRSLWWIAPIDQPDFGILMILACFETTMKHLVWKVKNG